jgi:MFS transporter, ACS family, tartrate transporter
VIGGPVSGACLAMDGIAGLRGWQWLFLLEGIPSIVFGFVVIFALTDKPDHATWLSGDEQKILRDELARSNAESAAHHGTLRDALRDSRLWLLSAIYLFLTFGLYSFGYWMPKLIKSVSKYSDAKVAIVSAIPYGIAAIAMIIVGRHSDRKNEQRWHAALAALIAACGFAGATFCENASTLLAALSVAATGIWCAVPPFWSIPSLFLRDRAAAGGIAAINSIGNLGGFFGPFLFGWIKQRSGASYTWALLATAASMMVCGLLVLMVPKAHPAAQRLA